MRNIILLTDIVSASTETLSNGWKYVGEWREGKPWNITIYGKSGITIMKYVNGVEQK